MILEQLVYCSGKLSVHCCKPCTDALITISYIISQSWFTIILQFEEIASKPGTSKQCIRAHKMRLGSGTLFIGYWSILAFSSSTALMLTCDRPNFTCPDSPVSCKCEGLVRLFWTITSTATGSQLLNDPVEITLSGDNPVDFLISKNGYTGIVCNFNATTLTLSSKLTFNLSRTENLSVNCTDTFNIDAPETVSLQRPSKLIRVYRIFIKFTGFLASFMGSLWLVFLWQNKPNTSRKWCRMMMQIR